MKSAGSSEFGRKAVTHLKKVNLIDPKMAEAHRMLGVIYLVYLWARHRQRVIDTGLVHLDADPEEVPAR